MKKLLSAAVMAIALVVAGCGGSNGNNGSQQGFGYIRAINLSPNSGLVDIRFRGQDADQDIAYGESSPEDGDTPVAIEAGEGAIQFVVNGETQTTVTQSINPQRDHVYHAVFAGLVGSIGGDAPRVLVANDRTADLSRTQANLRLVHASTLIDGPIDLYAVQPDGSIQNVQPLISNLAKYSISPLIKLNAGDYRIVVTAAGSKNPIVDVTDTAPAGNYTFGALINDENHEGVTLTSFSSDL
jgi:hypothetical protein